MGQAAGLPRSFLPHATLVLTVRVVSLLASATEIVCALDRGNLLVGRSHECDHPTWVRALPCCSEPAFDVTVSSEAIHAEVGRRIRAGEPLYRIDRERIVELRPDLIFAQEHCDVCAITPGDVGCIPGARIVSLNPGSLAGVFDSILQVAEALEIPNTGRGLVNRVQARLDHLREVTSRFDRPTVVVLEWADPFFSLGNWGPALVDIAGGELLLGNPDRHSTAIPAECLRDADPEFLIVAPCGFDLGRACQELAVLERHAWWNDLGAVRSGRVAFADGNLYFNRSGMTLIDTAEIITEILHAGGAADGSRWRWLRDVRPR